MRLNPRDPEVTLTTLEQGFDAWLWAERWHWKLTWTEDGPEPVYRANGTLRSQIRPTCWNGGRARTQKAAQKAAARAWKRVLKEAREKPSVTFSFPL